MSEERPPAGERYADWQKTSPPGESAMFFGRYSHMAKREVQRLWHFAEYEK